MCVYPTKLCPDVVVITALYNNFIFSPVFFFAPVVSGAGTTSHSPGLGYLRPDFSPSCFEHSYEALLG